MNLKRPTKKPAFRKKTPDGHISLWLLKSGKTDYYFVTEGFNGSLTRSPFAYSPDQVIEAIARSPFELSPREFAVHLHETGDSTYRRLIEWLLASEELRARMRPALMKRRLRR